MPECKVRPDFFVHIKCGEASKCFVNIPLCGLFVFVVVFLSSGSGVLLVIVFLRLCSVSPSVAMFFCGCAVLCRSGICATGGVCPRDRGALISEGLSPFLSSFAPIGALLGCDFPRWPSSTSSPLRSCRAPLLPQSRGGLLGGEVLASGTKPWVPEQVWPVLCFHSGRPPV